MKTFKYLFFSILTFALIGGYFAYKYDKKYYTETQYSTLEDKTDDSTTRELELGNVLQKTTKTDAEQSVIFNDPAISQAWGLKKTDAAKAWEVSTGSRGIIVAVIDTGIDVDHEDLKANLWINKNEIPNNRKDDDGNGYIDDVHGWNFVSDNNDLTDNHGHGTHIAGIVGAEGGNNKGITGIAPKVSIMTLKYFDPKVPYTDNLKNTIKSIEYAVKMGAHIINYSGGGTDFSNDEKTAVEEARKKGILFVAAAGNERSNSDHHKYYPADYGLTNIISVTAIDPTTEVLSSSNYGIQTVDIAAPGQNIVSTLPGNTYGLMTGTSQATAFVTGAAALIMAHKQNFIAEDVKKYILATGDTNMSLIAKTKTSRKLNLYKSLTVLDQDIAVNGKKAINAANIKPVTLDPNAVLRTPGSSANNINEMMNFSKKLMKNIKE